VRNNDTKLNMNLLTNYIDDLIGLRAVVKPFVMKGQLPLYLIESYEFNIVQIEQKEILILTLKDDCIFSIGQLEKHQQYVKKLYKNTIVFVFSQLEAYNRKRLVEHKIGFIVPFKQLYIPEFLLDFRETGLTIKSKTKHVTPIGQLLVLLYILDKYNRNNITNLSFKELASLVNVKPMEITRAAANLNELGLIEIHGAKDKRIKFEYDRSALWHHAIEGNMFIHPVLKTIYTTTLPNTSVLKSNTSALPEYSDMNPSQQQYYAIDKKTYYDLKKNKDFQMNRFEGKYGIEVWKYNPNLLSEITEPEDATVDPLSLFLALRETNDERIELALEQITDKFIW